MQLSPILKLLLPFIVGVIISNHYGIIEENNFLFIYTVIFIASFQILIRTPILKGSISFLVMLTVGFYCFQYHCVKPRFTKNMDNTVLRVEKVLKRSSKSVKVIGKLYYNDNSNEQSENDISGIGVFYFGLAQKDSINKGSILKIQSPKITVIDVSSKWDSFVFHKYGATFKCNFIKEPVILYAEKRHKSTDEEFRNTIAGKIESWQINARTKSFILAIVTGDKKSLGKEDKTDFACAGTAHILAISGLHVGILFVILSYLIKPLLYVFGRWAMLLPMIVLWVYAGCTGFSESVLRTVIMLSIIQFGKIINRNSNPLNSISTAALIILILDPHALFLPGFQLSFSAVFFLIYILPWLYRSTCPENKWLARFYGLALVSTVAQAGTFPVSTYWFETFPSYFLPANMISVPLVSLVLPVIFITLLVPFESVGVYLQTGCEYGVNFLFDISNFFANLPGSQITLQPDSLMWLLPYYVFWLMLRKIIVVGSLRSNIAFFQVFLLTLNISLIFY